jgi:predicted branched-subunit amino acid permease
LCHLGTGSQVHQIIQLGSDRKLENAFVRQFHWISVGMVVAGVLLAALTIALPLDRFWLLAGSMLILSGAVKLVILRLWRELVQPTPSTVSTPSGPPVAPRKR